MGIKAYKGFDKDLKCSTLAAALSSKYEIGKTYTHEGSVSLCSSGFHACEDPIDMFGYYAPINGNRFCEVEMNGIAGETEKDTKRVCSKIFIGGELSIRSITEASIKFLFEKTKSEPSKETDKQAESGNYSKQAASGNSSTQAASGNYANMGQSSTQAASGDSSKQAASGDSSTGRVGLLQQQAASGNYSKQAASGNYSKQAASGDSSNRPRRATTANRPRRATPAHRRRRATTANRPRRATPAHRRRRATTAHRPRRATPALSNATERTASRQLSAPEEKLSPLSVAGLCLPSGKTENLFMLSQFRSMEQSLSLIRGTRLMVENLPK